MRAAVPAVKTVSRSSAIRWLVALSVVVIAAGVVAVRVICACSACGDTRCIASSPSPWLITLAIIGVPAAVRLGSCKIHKQAPNEHLAHHASSISRNETIAHSKRP